MGNIIVLNVRGIITDELDEVIDYSEKLPSDFEEIGIVYNKGTKKYLDRKKKLAWIEHRGRAFKYKNYSKVYNQYLWERDNSDDSLILPDKVVNALETIVKSGVNPVSKQAQITLDKHKHSKKCRNLRRGVDD